MRRILTAIIAVAVVGSMAMANEIGISATGQSFYGDPTVSLAGGALAIGNVTIGESISASFERTMTLVAPNATHASNYQVTVKMKTSANNWRGISAFQVSSTSPAITNYSVSTNGSYYVLPQTFAAAVSPGTEYPLIINFASSILPTSAGEISETVYVNALYQ